MQHMLITLGSNGAARFPVVNVDAILVTLFHYLLKKIEPLAC